MMTTTQDKHFERILIISISLEASQDRSMATHDCYRDDVTQS